MAKEWQMEDFKNCAVCGELKQIKEFAPNKVRGVYQYNRCRPCDQKKKHDWNKANYERQYENQKARMKENPEFYSEIRRKYNENNPEKIQEMRKNWQDKNADYVQYKKNVVNVINNNKISTKMIEIYGNKCCYCEKKLDKTSKYLKPSVDHFVPLTLSGTNDIYNLTICCISCNSSKNYKSPEEFFKEEFNKVKNKIKLCSKIFENLYPELSKKLSDIPPFIKLE